MSAPERRQAAILFVELRNFTRLSEVLAPEVVLALANDFFTLAARTAAAAGGKVLAVHNDSIGAAFSGPDRRQFAEAALKAAQSVQSAFGILGERWKTEYGLPAAVSLGLHLGEAVFGMAGPKGGEPQYVAFGDCVSIAERLVHRARAGEIVISLDLMRALGETVKTLGAEELPPLDLGRRPPVAIYGMLLETRLDFT